MRSGVGEGEHRPPGMADQGRARVAAIGHDGAQVFDVAGDGQGRVIGAALKRLQRTKLIREPARQRCGRTRRARAAVQDDDDPAGRAIAAEHGGMIGHLRLSP